MAPLRSLIRLAMPVSTLSLWACGGGDLVLPGGDEVPQVQVIQGNGQQGRPGQELTPLQVRVIDPGGDGVPDLTVLWVVRSGGGSVTPTVGATDANGFATAVWTLGPEAGENTVDAQVSGIDTVTFTATATDEGGGGGGGGTPDADRSSVSADPTTIQATTETSTITVRVRDSNGDPVEGATVVLQATGDGNTLTQPSAATGSDGIATGILQSTSPGTKVVSATVNGSVQLSDSVEITVTAASPPPPPGVDHLIFLVQPQDVRRNESFSVKVALVDASEEVVPLQGIVIYVALFDGDDNVTSHLEGDRFVATVDGVSTFDLKVTRKGKYRLRALTDDLPELGPHGPEPFLFSRLFEVK